MLLEIIMNANIYYHNIIIILLRLYSFYSYFLCKNEDGKSYPVYEASFPNDVLTSFFKLFNQHE